MNDVWATFTATAANARFRTDVAGTVGTDSDFVIYQVDQGNVCDSGSWVVVGCSEDEASPFLGDISIDGLVVGDTYLIQMGSWADSPGAFELEITCPAPGGICGDGIISSVPGGEECDGAATGSCLTTCNPDCTCTFVPTPMLPKWGLIGLALMLVVGGVAVFGRGRTGAVQV